MPQDYVERKIQDALKLTQGNITKTRQLIQKWAQEDLKLLHGLTKTHLNGVIAYHIERAISGRDKSKAKPIIQPAARGKEQFGMEILKAAVNSGSVFGLEAGGPVRNRKQASQQHIDAIKKLASKNKTKK